ncbi:MAG: pilus assembly protein N-terminal domain-containing protein [Myxococcaceae bacterium]|nr:pilus assembly protein N-terminal domain-containing protein [Myxococcaceae bacterium]
MAPLLALVIASTPLRWDGRSPVEVGVGTSVSLEVPRALRFVSVGGGDVVEVAVSRDLRTVQLRGLRRGSRTVVAHFQDRTRAQLELKVVGPARSGRR